MPDRPDSDREVLTSLPRSRPARRSAKRGERAVPGGAARSAAKPARGAAKPARGAAKPSRSAAKPAAARAASAAEGARVAPERKIPAAGYAAPDGRAGETTGSPAAELVSTTIQAAAELAQIGLTVGRQTLQSMLERLPKP